MTSEAPVCAKRRKLDYADTLFVLVRPDEVPFMVHAVVAQAHSKFFKTACSGSLKEAQTKTIHLPKAEPDVFKVYLQWLYTGHVAVADDVPLPGLPGNSPVIHYHPLIQLYVLANMLDDLPLRNKVTTEIFALFNPTTKYPSPKATRLAYEQTPRSSKLRELIAHCYEHIDDPEQLREFGHGLSAELLLDVVVLSKERKRSGALRRIHYCTFHEHNEEFPRLRCLPLPKVRWR